VEPLLREIVLEGFKSFRDRTSLRFDGPFTAIVGPNGSGKSNVVDAVKWVLGDPSPRSIRASSGLEAVYRSADGDGEEASGFASVILKVDNPRPESDEEPSQWEIERRYYRSGESVYTLNGRNARLKDVRAVMARMGFGLGSLSVVGQGEIDGFLSLVPSDRRLVFEDLARISDFKANKRRILGQLEDCARNHQRMQDLTGEILIRVDALAVQAKAARRHAELSAAQKEAEAQLAAQEYLLAKRNLERHEQRLEDLVEELGNSRTGRDEAVRALASAKQALDNARKENAATLSECESGKRELERAGAEERRLTEANQHLGTLLGTLEHELSEREARIEKLRSRGRDLTGTVGKANVERAWAKRSRLDFELYLSWRWGYMRSCERERERLAGRVERLQGEGSFFARDAEFHTRRAEALQAEAKELRGDLAKLRAEMGDAERSSADLAAEYDRLQTARGENGKLMAELEVTVRSTHEGLDSAQDRKRDLSTEIAALESERKLLAELETAREGYGEGVKGILSRRDEFPGLRGTLGELIEVEPGGEEIIERILGDSLEFLVCDTLSDALQVIDAARRDDLGPVTCVVRELVPEIAADARGSDLLAMCSIAGDLMPLLALFLGGARMAEGPEDIENSDYSGTLITAEGIVFRPPAFVSGGSDVGGAKGLLTRRARLDELDRLIVARRWKLGEIEATTHQLEVEECDLEERLSIARRLSAEIRDNLQQTIVERQRHAERLQRARKESSTIEKKLREVEAECDGCRENARLASQGTKAVRRARTDAEEALERIERELPGLAGQVEDLRSRLQRAIVEEASYKEEAERALAEIERLDEEIESIRREIATRNERLDEIRNDARGTSEELDRAIDLRTTLEKRLPELGRMEKEAGERIGRFEKGLSDAELALEEARERVSSIESSVHTQEVRLAELRGGLTSLEKGLDGFPEFAERIRSGELSGKDIPSKKELAEKLDILGQELGELGDVNPLAIQEEKLARNRLDELKREREDLIKAEEELREALEEVEKESVRAFISTFDEAKERFAEVFAALFPGGSGELSLTDPSDPLESGIDVRVRFPGKGELDLLQFSGGERALIALALLFAILKVKPSSFTILDEVEAALDDVNTQKFLDYLGREFPDRQFVLVTHNKISMERANRLYGVTMGKEGVSQVVSVDLKKLKEEGIEEVLGGN